MDTEPDAAPAPAPAVEGGMDTEPDIATASAADPPTAAESQEPPAVAEPAAGTDPTAPRFAVELQTLRSMGFEDESAW